jgi:monofunctional biosynthetic peptidoglycan transglycosylase
MHIKTIFNFNNGGGWEPINDAVMGGVSEGFFEITRNNCLRFQGNVSPENNGGFASIKSIDGSYDLSGFTGIYIKVKGDGKTYKLNLRTTEFKSSYYYQQRFTTANEQWQEVYLPFKDFEPISRGRKVFLAPELSPDKVISFGLMISDKQFGGFSLEIESIKVYG